MNASSMINFGRGSLAVLVLAVISSCSSAQVRDITVNNGRGKAITCEGESACYSTAGDVCSHYQVVNKVTLSQNPTRTRLIIACN